MILLHLNLAPKAQKPLDVEIQFEFVQLSFTKFDS